MSTQRWAGARTTAEKVAMARLALERYGSYREAADALGLSHATLWRFMERQRMRAGQRVAVSRIDGVVLREPPGAPTLDGNMDTHTLDRTQRSSVVRLDPADHLTLRRLEVEVELQAGRAIPRGEIVGLLLRRAAEAAGLDEQGQPRPALIASTLLGGAR